MNPAPRRRAAVAGACLAVGTVALWGVAKLVALAVPLPYRLAQPSSSVVEFRDGTPAHVFLSPDGKWRLKTSLADLDPAYVRALVRLEDKRFWYHAGVDPFAIVRAVASNVRRGHRVSGASTLTLQLVRVLEPRPRTIPSKAIEALRAFQLELCLSKAQILEAYLELAPFGQNVEGVEAASWTYFGHSARSLTAAEIATLLAVPQDPTRRHPTLEHAVRLERARAGVARRLEATGGFTPSQRAAASADPVPGSLKPFPRRAFHASVWLHQRYPGVARIRTTLDCGQQTLVEQTLGAAREGLGSKGIHNAAVVVADHQAGEVRALLGNFDFWDQEHGGEIAGFDRARSTGSALKPFLFAHAIDRGIALPGFLVPDLPTRYGTFTPHNYDGSYSGLVPLSDALSQSLNAPFVALLKDAGVERFLSELRGMGATGLDPAPGRYGLNAIVGGLELSPLEVAGMYAALAENGRFRPLALVTGGRPVTARQAFSPGAAFLTRQALSRRDRPDFPDRSAIRGLPGDIHWKTGTSYGHRDAWAAGSGPRFTAVVWTGNFDQSSSASLVGADASGPLLFDLLEGLSSGTRVAPAAPPSDLVEVEVCAYSGYPAGDDCPDHKRVLAPRSSVPTQKCPFHTSVEVDVHTGLALAPTCRQGHDVERRHFLAWPQAVRRWLHDDQRALPEPPALSPDCTEVARDTGGLSLVSPAPGQVALLMPGIPEDRQRIPLEANARATRVRLSWFVDGAFLGTTASQDRLWWQPSPGHHEVAVMDDAGNSFKSGFDVQRTRF